MNIPELTSCTLTELSLSVDNVMVWAVIINRVDLPAKYHRAVLAAGVGIALILRVVAIVAGADLLHRFDWLTYVLGAVLVWTGYRIARSSEGEESGDGRVMRAASKVLRYPPLVAIVALGATDLVFAVDSIPASFSITRDPWTIGVANGIALAALWSLYGVVSRLIDRFAHLSRGLAVIMVWLGVSMWVHIPEYVTLTVIVGALGVSMLASIKRTEVAA